MAPPRSLGDRLSRLYRGLLILYPAEFREEYGHELALAFADGRCEERSAAGLLRYWLHAVRGIFREAPREHCHMILQDLRYAVRVMRKEPGVTAAAIAIMAMGIGSTTLVFSLANGLLLRPLPYAAPDQIVAVDEYSPHDPREKDDISFPDYADIRARTRLLQNIGVYGGGAVSIVGQGAAERLPAGEMSDGVWGVLGVAPVLGRVFTRAEDRAGGPHVVVIGEGLWQRRYGRDPSVIGKVLDTGNARYTIIGIMPAGFHFPDLAELWFPLRLDPAKVARTDYGLQAVARLKPGVTVLEASAELRALLAQIHRENPAANNGWGIRARPLREQLSGDYREAVLTLLVAVGFLLLIACANVSNLLLVKASGRSREMAMRTALGATRRRLLRQLFSESLVLGMAGGVAGVALARVGTPALLSLVPIDLPHWMDFSLDGRVLGFALAISLATSVAFGMAPALGSRCRDVGAALKEGGRGGTVGRQRLLRNGLVAGEVALSIMLLTGAGLMIRSFLALRLQNLGYQPEKLLSLQISYPEREYPSGPPARALLRKLTAEIGSLPGVVSLAFTTGVPLHDGWTRIFTIEGHPVPLRDMPFADHVVIAPGYFRTLGVPLVEGRDFTDADYDSPNILIVTQSFARRYFPDSHPIGKRVRFGPPDGDGKWNTIVGVVADNRHSDLRHPGRPCTYLPFGAYGGGTPNSIVIRATRDPLRLVPAAKARIAAVGKDIALSHIYTLDQLVDRASWQDRFFSVLFAAFAAMALALAAVGLYAVLSYTVALQTHEIGIRMALGASAASVRGMVLRSGMAMALAGLAVGLVAAAALTRLLKAQLFHISPLDPATYIVAPVVLLLAALAAAFLPTLRATRVDPVIALRHE